MWAVIAAHVPSCSCREQVVSAEGGSSGSKNKSQLRTAVDGGEGGTWLWDYSSLD